MSLEPTNKLFWSLPRFMQVMDSAVKEERSYFLMKEPSDFFQIRRSRSWEQEIILSDSSP